MKKFFSLIILGLAISGMLNAQTMNVQVGQVTYQFPAEQTGVMNYADGTTLNVMGKVFTLADVTDMYVDESEVEDNSVSVVYNETSATVTVAGNVAKYLTVSVSGAHVDIAQSEDLAEEITYTLSGSSTDGEFYMSGSYKATVELNGLTLTNTNPVTSGAAVHIQNGKRIKVKVMDGTTNTLVDCASGSQKGAFYVKGHPEFSKSGVLNVVGNLKHAIKAGEYIELKNATINVTSAQGDGINCAQYFLMESGTININNVTDDGIQCDIENPDTTTDDGGDTGGDTGGTTGTVPTNAELWEAFKPYYNTYYGDARADQTIENVATFMQKGEAIFTDSSSEYKWLGDYLVQVATAQGYTIDSEALWRWHADSFFNCRQHTSWPKTADFTTAGQPSAWGSAYLAANGASAIVKRTTGETPDHEDEDSGNIYIEGGKITINTAGKAAKGIKSEGDIYVKAGEINITTTGHGKWDEDDVKTKAAACLGSDAKVVISGGTLVLTSTGAGGKGINCDAEFELSGGDVTIVTKGALYYHNGTTENTNYTGNTDNVNSDYYSSSKGVKSDGAIKISGGRINVSTAGLNAEGIESKTSILISDGEVIVNSYDDGINVGGDGTDLIIEGGYVYSRAMNNDGIDGNGNVYVKGGLVYAIGANSPEVAIDANSEEQKKLYVQGGTLIAVGGLESGAQISGGTCKQASSMTANSWYALYNGSELVAAFKTPATSSSSSGGGRPGGSSSGKLVVYTSSTPALKSGVTVSGGTAYFDGAANIGGSVSGGSDVTLSNYTSSGRP
ncbi:MAG: carbohydrate-binding domain-containing protein [Paludibacteraceae bacterium]|nr:carbohydrate-binding domain-containing protein [Paludibacteraceae bacterium]